ncbi:hypothetical protein AMTR_s00079p00170790 [Amborella trichopoda]|uniref:Uncharacterized protein n=1 Tax=Amborella trichopoda TaxID=13333 RepID=W1P2D5_AMBTC|nr:hypothetical protein AMTR_s00079p00170790 [Amborella trichopoda]
MCLSMGIAVAVDFTLPVSLIVVELIARAKGVDACLCLTPRMSLAFAMVVAVAAGAQEERRRIHNKNLQRLIPFQVNLWRVGKES